MNWKIDIWKEGKYIDFWSVNHILAGSVLGGLVILTKTSFWSGFIVSVLLMLGWEIYEYYKPVYEYWGNKFMDMVTGIFGFLVMYLLPDNLILTTFIIVTIIFIFLEIWGYWAYKYVVA